MLGSDLAEKIKERKEKPEVWESLTAEQKKENEDLYKTATKTYDAEGRVMDEEEEVTVRGKVIRDANGKEVRDAAGNKMYEYEKKKIQSQGKSLSDVGGGVGQEGVNEGWVAAAKTRMETAAKGSDEKAKYETRTQYEAALKAYRDDFQQGTRPKDVPISDDAQGAVRDEVRSSGISRVGSLVQSGLGKAGTALKYAALFPITLMEGTEDLISGAITGGIRRAGDLAHDSAIAMNPDKAGINSIASNAQSQLNSSNYAVIGSTLDRLATQVVTALGANAGAPSGDMEPDPADPSKRRSITNQQVVEREISSAKNAAITANSDELAASANPGNIALQTKAAESRAKAQQLIQNVILNYSTSAETSRASVENIQVQSGSEVGVTQAIQKSLGKVKKSRNEAGARKQIQDNLEQIKTGIIDSLRDRRASNTEIEAEMKNLAGLQASIESLSGAGQINNQIQQMENYVKELEAKLKTGSFFKIKS